jgi:hypothetical protein
MAGPSMAILVIKLTLTPLLIGATAVVGRRWGPAIGGWIIGIPFTSGPIALVLALSNGSQFARAASVGILAGTGSEALFCLAYAWVASHFDWRLSLLAGVAGFAAATTLLLRLTPTLISALAIAVASVAAALLVSPRLPAPAAASSAGAAVDVVTRMAVGIAVVLTLTGAAPLLGPTLTGLLSPFPVFGAVMMVFSQRLLGGPAGIAAAQGLLWGLFGAAAFFLILAGLLPHIGLPAFAVAVLGGLAIQGSTLPMVRRHQTPTVG